MTLTIRIPKKTAAQLGAILALVGIASAQIDCTISATAAGGAGFIARNLSIR